MVTRRQDDLFQAQQHEEPTSRMTSAQTDRSQVRGPSTTTSTPMPPQSPSKPIVQLPILPHEVEIHYIKAWRRRISTSIPIPELPQSTIVFTRTISALDLATTPVALVVAAKYTDAATDWSECKSPSFFFYPSRSIFPRDYRPFRSARLKASFPLLHAAVASHEKHVLRSLVLSNSRSVPISFDLEGRILPMKAEDVDFIGSLSETLMWFAATPMLPSSIPRSSAFDSWDLACTGIAVKLTFHQNCTGSFLSCKCESSTLRWADCKRWVLLDGHWYRRRFTTTYRRALYYRRWGESRTWAVTRLAIKCLAVGLLLTVSVPMTLWNFVGYFIFFNSISGGALLHLVSKHVRYIQFIFNKIDRAVCPAVVTSPLPCTLAANPDVTGVGIRIASYSQLISLMTLLAFSPAHANPSRWALATTSVAFGISAIASATAGQLSLYHMVLAAKFQTLPLLVTAIIEVKSPNHRGTYLSILNHMRWAVNSAIILWYSFTAPCFGSQPSCNAYVRSQSYFLIAQATSASARATAIINALLTTQFLLYDVYLTWDSRRHTVWKPTTFPKSYGAWILHSFAVDNTTPLRPRATKPNQTLPPPATMPTHERKFLLCIKDLWDNAVIVLVYALPYPKFWRYIIALAFAIMLVCNIERTIAINVVSGDERVWTYGQVLAVALGVVPAVQLLQMLGLAPKESSGHAKSKRD